MLIMTRLGLYCQAGNFYIDPSRAVENAVITHSHSDHARRGSKQYYTVNCGISLLRARIGKNISVIGFEYGQKFNLGDAQVSFHPAGHILGSSQIRIKVGDEIWVASGDYKRDTDPTCHPFEVVNCDVFVTEATFGTPAFKWEKNVDLGKQIFEWWNKNSERGLNSVLFAYSLGKAQRILGVLEPYMKNPVYCYHTVTALNECYRAEGIKLAATICLSEVDDHKILESALLLAPQAFLDSDRGLKILGGENKFVTAFASGWNALKKEGYGSYDHGFVMSDHADWNDLVQTIQETGAKRVYVQHRNGVLVRHLKTLGIDAYHDSRLLSETPNQMVLF